MKLIGLGGGIGAGKSSASERFRVLGAVIVDADVIARQVVEPGTPALAAIVQRFGVSVLRDDASLDRGALAAIVFADSDALKDLNAITHPAIGVEMQRQLDEHGRSDRVVIYDAALLFDTARVDMVGRIAIDVDPEIAVARLVGQRGFSIADARARIAAQMSRADRLARADYVIDNSGTPADLDAGVARAWTWIASLPDSVVGRDPAGI